MPRMPTRGNGTCGLLPHVGNCGTGLVGSDQRSKLVRPAVVLAAPFRFFEIFFMKDFTTYLSTAPVVSFLYFGFLAGLLIEINRFFPDALVFPFLG